MIKSTVLSVCLALGFATAAHAAYLPLPPSIGNDAIVKVGEGCGWGMWRGPDGRCNPFYGPGGPLRGTQYECPPGFHIGPGRARCWPNR